MITFIVYLLRLVKFHWIRRSNESFIRYLRRHGVTIGDKVLFRVPERTKVDLGRASLIEIGNNVDFNDYCTLMAHDYQSHVFREVYKDFVNSSGPIKIGDNVYFGTNVTVLKNVTIGDNCIIGAGSLVTHSIPANSVAAGVPCKVLFTLDDFYKKRKKEALFEAFEYANSIERNLHRQPVLSDFFEEFIYFKGATEKMIDYQLRDKKEEWKQKHEYLFPDIHSFLKAAKDYEQGN